MNKLLAFLTGSLLLISYLQPAKGQADDCNSTRIAVKVNSMVLQQIIYDVTLTAQYGSRTKEEWKGFVEQMVADVFSEYEPGIVFFPYGKGGGDFEYFIRVDLSMNKKGEGNEEQTVFWMRCQLIANTNCIGERYNNVVDIFDGGDPDLQQTIKNVAAQFYPMERNIIRYEQDHPTPPRDPRLEIKIDKDYLSPIDKESRKTKVHASVYNCRGEEVCDPRGSTQPVYYQDYLDRLHLKLGNCEGGYHIRNYMVIVTNKYCENEGEYRLEKGMEAEKKNIKFKTCRLGSGPYIVKDKELIIRGLKVEVKPDKKKIEVDQHTQIVISLKETDPDGNEYPVADQDIKVKIIGLLNGTVKPLNGYTTDAQGEVKLDYKAGNKDELITVQASFQPEDYPDKAEGKASVLVKPPEYDARLTIRRWATHEILTEEEDQAEDQGCETYTYNRYTLNERTDGSITIQLKLMYAADMPIFNQRWEYYQPVNVVISGFFINHDESHLMTGHVSGMGCAVGGHETHVSTFYRVTGQKINEPPSAPWIIAFDNQTGKAVKMTPGGYSIRYNLDITEQTDSRSWDKNGQKGDNQEDHKVQEDQTFGVGPVEDPIPDPHFKGVSGIFDYLKEELGDSLAAAMPPMPPQAGQQEAPKVNPDLLVRFGDGENSFGGRGHTQETIPRENGSEKTESEYSWNMIRYRKKNN